MRNEEFEEFLEVLSSFSHAMLVTQRDRELRSRPMAIADCDDRGRISFITSIDSAKLDELTEEPNINLALQSDTRFLSISGTTKTSRDRSRIDALWSPLNKAWFPEGKDDPSIAVLTVVPTYAEYWDRSGAQLVRTAFEIGKSMLTGGTPSLSDKSHAKIDFPSASDFPSR